MASDLEQTPKQRLKKIFTEALGEPTQGKFVYILVQNEEHKSPELIVNPRANILDKMEYYEWAYDDNLVLKANPGIKVIEYGWANSLKVIPYDEGMAWSKDGTVPISLGGEE